MSTEPSEDAPEPIPGDGKRDHPNDPLHGVTLKALLEELVDRYGWDALADQIRIRCFARDPSIASSLKFLRRTPWARKKVEQLYVDDFWDERRRDESS